jgi:hypothetical protein
MFSVKFREEEQTWFWETRLGAKAIKLLEEEEEGKMFSFSRPKVNFLCWEKYEKYFGFFRGILPSAFVTFFQEKGIFPKILQK